MSTPLSRARLFASLAKTYTQRPSTAHLLPSIVSTALGHGPIWVPEIYWHFSEGMPEAPPPSFEEMASKSRISTNLYPHEEKVERKKLLREMKEGLVKSAILIGVPRVIETLLALTEEGVVEPEARDSSFVRAALGKKSEEREMAGVEGLASIYRGDIEPIWEKMVDIPDIEWMSKSITYGTFLAPYPPHTAQQPSLDPLAFDPTLLSVVTLSALVSMRCEREILWHLRGALRLGLSRPEVEQIHSSIAAVCEELGVKDVRLGMPNVKDVEVQEGEKVVEEA